MGRPNGRRSWWLTPAERELAAATHRYVKVGTIKAKKTAARKAQWQKVVYALKTIATLGNHHSYRRGYDDGHFNS